MTLNEVLVWNAELVEAIGDKNRSRRGPTRLVLTVASLRELARRLPDEYPFPQDIPASHVPQARHEGRAKRRNAESVRNDPSAHVDTSDDDDEFDFKVVFPARRYAVKKLPVSMVTSPPGKVPNEKAGS